MKRDENFRKKIMMILSSKEWLLIHILFSSQGRISKEWAELPSYWPLSIESISFQVPWRFTDSMLFRWVNQSEYQSGRWVFCFSLYLNNKKRFFFCLRERWDEISSWKWRDMMKIKNSHGQVLFSFVLLFSSCPFQNFIHP